MAETVIAGGIRSALGAFDGSLSGIEMTDLAATVAAGCIARAGINGTDLDHIVLASTVPSGRDSLFGARVVGIKAGLPESSGALAVVRACASGLQAILSAAQQVDIRVWRSRAVPKAIPVCRTPSPPCAAGSSGGLP